MAGFVSALAASLAILTVFLSLVAVNVAHITIQEKDSKVNIKVNKKDSNDSKNGSIQNLKGFNSKSYILSKKDVDLLKNSHKSFTLQCTYGDNFSKEAADRYATFNYILLLQEGIKVTLLKSQDTGLNVENKCNIFVEDDK